MIRFILKMKSEKMDTSDVFGMNRGSGDMSNNAHFSQDTERHVSKRRRRNVSMRDSSGSEYEESEEDSSEQYSESRKFSQFPIPRPEDIFRSSLGLMSSSVMETMRSHGFLRPLFQGKSVFTHDSFMRKSIEATVELWLLSFGIHLIQISRHQFIQSILRVQQLDDPRYKYDLDENILSKLFWLSGTTNSLEHNDPFESEESFGMVSLPELCFLFMWLGPPEIPFNVSPRKAISRSYDWIHSDPRRIRFYEGICSNESACFKVAKEISEVVYRLVEGNVTVSTTENANHVQNRTVYVIRDLCKTDISLNHSRIFNDGFSQLPVEPM